MRFFFVSLMIALVTTPTMTSHSHVVKRADDSNPLTAVVGAHSQTLTQLEARMQALENAAKAKAAFRGELTGTVVAGAPIKFATIYAVEQGSNYDPVTGIFTVASPGVYTFQYQLWCPDASPYVMDLYVNGHIEVRSRCYDGSPYTVSCSSSVCLHLATGDKVWLQSDHAGDFYSGVHSYFSGALLSADQAH